MYDFYNDIGLFRFSIISPIINNTHNCASISEYIRFAASKTYTFNEKSYTFSESCIKNWYLSYKKNGFDALRSKERNDKNKSRRLSNEAILKIIDLRSKYPNITGTSIYNKLVEENYIHKNKVSLTTLLRFLKNNNLKASQVCNIERSTCNIRILTS